MITSAMTSPRIYAIQNSLAALVFALLLMAQGVAYLLYLNPSSELLWALTIFLNRVAAPVLSVFDFGFGHGPFLSLTVLATAVVVPLLAWRARYWFGTAVSGHAALALCVVLTVGAVRRIGESQRSASLLPFADLPPVDSNALCLALVTIAMAILCIINHAMFFHKVRQS